MHALGRLTRGVALAFLVAATNVAAEPPDANALSGPALLAALRQGGNVIYLRHGLTERSTTDASPVDLSNCRTQRPLSDEGRKQAAGIGKAFRDLGIPVGDVLTSPYCRARETAEIAFGGGSPSDTLSYSKNLPADERQRLAKALRDLLSTPPQPGKNTILISHKDNLEDAVFILPKAEGVAWVFQPLGDGESKALGQVAVEQWGEWVGAPASAAP
jgi:phosphohistidine phosphatase SixA